MAPRKDMMRVIRRDAGFSATLGFGEGAGDPKDDRSPTSNARETLTPALAIKGEAGRGQARSWRRQRRSKTKWPPLDVT